MLLVGALPPVFSPSPARAATWLWVALPNLTDHPDSDLVQEQQPPYRLDWPGEGVSETGEQDPGCAKSPPFGNGRHVRTGYPGPTDLLTGVFGIWKRGPFVRVGNPTAGANHGANHLAVFFHTPDLGGRPCYRGGSEYGLVRLLSEGSTRAGDQPLDLYQCASCNCRPCIGTGRATIDREVYASHTTGWNDAEQDRIYRVSFLDFPISSFGVTCPSSKDNFFVEVVDPVTWKLDHSTKICRASWMPDLKGGSGWVTANAHADSSTDDGVDGFDGSYNLVTTVKWLSG